jgi:DNA polymerase-3 subunit gamma/tau
MTDAITNNSPEQIVAVIDTLMNEGKDLNTFVDSLMQYFRDLMMYSVSNGTIALDYNSEDMVKLKAQSARLSFERITRAASILSAAKSEAKWVKSPRIIYELALIKLARPEVDSSPEALLDRIAEMENKVHATRDEELYSRIAGIEEKIKNGIAVAAPITEEEPVKEVKKVSKRVYNPIPPSELNGDNPIVALAKRWDNICSAIIKKAGYLGMALHNRPITIDRDGIIMLFGRNENTTLDILNNNRNRLDTLFAQVSGTDYALKYVYDDEIGDNIIDIWSMKASSPPPSEIPEPSDEDVPEIPEFDENNTDPMDELLQDFSEIVDITDGTEFMEYSAEEDDFNQASLFGEENEREEFLEPGELGDEDE